MTVQYAGLNTLQGLSTDTKPTNVMTGFMFFETDTRIWFYFDGTSWTQFTGGGAGESNTASNAGIGGVGIVLSKFGVDLPFKSINSGSSKISITNDAGNKEIDIDVVESNINVGNLTGTLGINRGGTGQTSALLAFNAFSPLTTLGDILSHNGSTNIRVAGNTTITKKFLTETGDGVNSITPSWDTIAINDLPSATTSAKGIVELATSGENVASVVVQGNDSRLSDSRTPTAHKSSHVSGGSDAFIASDILIVQSRYLERVTDPTSDVGRVWINGSLLKFWDNAGTPIKHIVEVQTNKGIATGYCDLDGGALVPLSRLAGIVDSNIGSHTSTKITITAKGQLNSQIGYKDESNWVNDSIVSSHTSTKITITAKGQLNSNIAYIDQNNNFGAFYQDLAQISTPVNPPTGTRRIFVDNVDGKLKVRTATGSSLDLEGGGAGSGEANTASNQGVGGVGLFHSKIDVDLQFKNINAGSSKITVVNDVTNKEVDIDVTESALTLNNIGGTLGISKGGTGQTTVTTAFNGLSPLTTLGDLLYNDGTDDVRLAGNITTTKKFLRQTGNGTISAAPAWDTIVAGDLPTATTTTLGIVELATGGESASGVVVQGNDARLSDARIPTAHKNSHTSGGSDAFVKTDVLIASVRYLETITDPTTDAGRLWVETATKTLKYWDSQATPVKQTVEILANKGVASGYCDLDGSVFVPLSRLSNIGDAQIAAAGITTRSKLPSAIAYDDESNTFTALLNIGADMQISGDISPAQIIVNQNDYNPTGLSTSSVLRLTSDASRNITGLAGGTDGRLITIFNVGSNNIVLVNQDIGSTAANRFLFGSNHTITPEKSTTIWYDSTSSRWRLFSDKEGEVNTASNLGTGQIVFKQKIGVDLQFRTITATSTKIALVDNVNDIGIDVTEANLTLNNIGGTLGISKGGTGQTGATAAFNALSPSTTLGDIIYHNGTDDARLSGNITTTKKFLVQTGNGSVSAAPLWDTIVAGDLPTATTTALGIVELATSGENAASVVVQGNDSRLSDARTPTGTASGDLGGTYPSPLVKKVSEDFALTGDISPAQIIVNTNDYNPTGLSTATVLRLNTDVSRNITGLVGGSDGLVKIIHNIGSTDIVLTDQDLASTANNRFLFGQNLTLKADDSAIIKFDSTTNRWRLISTTIDTAGGDLTGTYPNPTIAANAITDGKIASHTSTKITITAKGQLNSQIGYKDETVWLTDSMIAASGITTRSKLPTALVYDDESNTFTALMDVGANLQLSGDISPAQIIINQNDYNPTGLSTASILRLNTDASRNITGLAGGADGRIVQIHNIGSTDIVLKNQDVGSSAANRFLFGADITLTAEKSVALWYDSTTSRWRVYSSTVSGGGGEANTASNVGTGQGVFKAKVGVDLQFRSITATSTKIALANNVNDIGIDVTEANLTLGNLGGTLGISKGGTGQTTALAAFNALSPLTTLGDLLYNDGTDDVRLAGNTTTTKKFLRQTGNGTVSAAPAWDTVIRADISDFAHAVTHKSGGSDVILLDELGAPTDVTTLNVSTTAHGLQKKLSNVATEFMNGAGNYVPVDVIPEDFAFTGDISPAQIIANQNDYNPTGLSTATILRLNTDASRNITGLVGGVDGRIIVIHNTGSTDLILTDQDIASVAGNRFLFGQNLTLKVDDSATIQYDSTTSRWRLISTTINTAGGDLTGTYPDPSVASGAITDAKINASGITTRSKLPTALAYEDEANSFTTQQTFQGVRRNLSTKTANYTVTTTDDIILGDATTAAFTLTLPATSGKTGQMYTVKKIDTSGNFIIIDGNASETIDGFTTYELRIPHQAVDIICDGTNWRILSHDIVDWLQFRIKGATADRRYPASLMAGDAVGTITPTVDTLYAMPMLVPTKMKFDLISIRVMTLGAGSSGRIGIYKDNGSMYPGDLVVDAGSFATSTTGWKDQAITQELQPGLYWLAFVCNATAPIISSQLNQQSFAIFGLSNSAGGTVIGLGYTVAFTFAALPNPFTSGGVIATGAQPAIAVRAAT